WIVADEMPVKSLIVQVFDLQGKVVMEQKFSSKTADWSLDLQALPAGRYSVVAGTQEPIRFRK
ncbi:MAG: T9SS type A sorting domain-containing protein, partial [Saprospiraceae bacterium]|nr:T9SS type A sorting domain-containing protein [Saprospiraceae bacterium]